MIAEDSNWKRRDALKSTYLRSRDVGTTGKKLPHLGILFTYVYYFEFQSIDIISLLAIGFISYNLQKNWYMYYVVYVYVMTRILLMKWA